MEKLLPSFIHLISYHLRNVTHWTFSFTLSTAGHSYLYSRNPWCAIFPVNPRQTLEQQANRSVDLIWRRLRTPPHPFFSPFHLRYLLFCQQLLVGPWYLGCPAEDKYPHCIRLRTSGFPAQILSNISLFCSIYQCAQFDSHSRFKKKKKWKKKIPYFVSNISCLSRWSLRPLLTLWSTGKGLE